MNEKIKELAEQSGFYFYDLHDIDGQDLGETIEADSWSCAEKFAELIIRECLDQVDEFGRLSKAFLEEGIDPEIDVTKEVLNNFGIES